MARIKSAASALTVHATGQLVVIVQQPPTGAGAQWMSGWGQQDGRQQWSSNYSDASYYGSYRPRGEATEDMLVQYTVLVDQAQLDDLVKRAAKTQNGTSVRGPATATRLGATINWGAGALVQALVQQAANAKTLAATDGPVTVKVILPRKPATFPLTCRNCQQPAEVHATETAPRQHDWQRDYELERHYCPEA